MIAINPKILDKLKILSVDPAKAAIIAPTIITDEMALVTDINGVCNDGVTLLPTYYPTNIERIKILTLNINGSISIIKFLLIMIF